MGNEYNDDLEINSNALDVAWLEQPKLYGKYADKVVEAKEGVDDEKQNLDNVRAKLDLDIRSNKEKYDLEKITEAVVANTILIQDDYIEAVHDYNEANYNHMMMQNACKALDHRKKALENLVTLHGHNYFASPKEPRNLDKEYTKSLKTKGANEKVKSAMKRKKR